MGHNVATMPLANLSAGTFCWFELATLDQEAAKRFYTAIFPWQVKDEPTGPNETYSMFRIGGHVVAADAEHRIGFVRPGGLVFHLPRKNGGVEPLGGFLIERGKFEPAERSGGQVGEGHSGDIMPHRVTPVASLLPR